MEKQFICMVAYLVKNSICSNAIIFESFEKAIKYARRDAEKYKHLSAKYVETIGVGKLHAHIQMNGKDFNKSYTIRDLNYDNSANILCDHLNTYASWDYDHKGICV